MLAMRSMSRIFLRAKRTHLPNIPLFITTRDHTHSSSTTVHTLHPLSKDKPSETLINLTVNKDVAGILHELENMHSSNSSSATIAATDQAVSTEWEPELASLAANLFFNEKVSKADVTSIEQCCDIFDLLAEKHPVLAQQGYSKLLELSLTKDRLLLVTCLCTRLLAQDVRLEKPFYDTLITYLTTCGQVEQAHAIARTIPITKQILFSLVEPLFLSGQHMAFAELFKTYCTPFNSDAAVADVNLVVTSMIWAKGLRQPPTHAEREVFVASIVRSLDAYKDQFDCLISRDSNHNTAVVDKLFYVMKDSVEHVFLTCEVADREGTAGAVSNLRRKFVTSRYFSPFPFMNQDCAVSTNFPPHIKDITSQMEDVRADRGGGAGGRSAFFLSNSMWAQDYADVINDLVEERDDEGPYYDDSDSSDSESEEESGDKEVDVDASSSDDDDDDDSSDEGGGNNKYTINVKLKLDGARSPSLKAHPSSSQSSPMSSRLHKRVDMEAHLARGRDELSYFHQRSPPETTRTDQMNAFVSEFQIEQKINLLLRKSAFLAPDSEQSDTRCPRKVAICDMMDNLAYVGAGRLDLSRVADISAQCREDSNIRLANDLFGAETQYHLSESAYDSLMFMKDDVSWGAWKR